MTFTLCSIVVGILAGLWSGLDVYDGRIGKAGLGMFYLIPTTAMVKYLGRFENYQNLLKPCDKEEDEEAHTDEEQALANDV